jgi:hypothetical protein
LRIEYPDDHRSLPNPPAEKLKRSLPGAQSGRLLLGRHLLRLFLVTSGAALLFVMSYDVIDGYLAPEQHYLITRYRNSDLTTSSNWTNVSHVRYLGAACENLKRYS